VVRFDCHPEQAVFAQRRPALSGVERDLCEPREIVALFATPESRVGLASFQTAPLPNLASALMHFLVFSASSAKDFDVFRDSR